MRKVILLALIVVPVLSSFNMGAQKRSYAAGRFALFVDGESFFPRSVKGLTGKSSGNAPITMEIGMGMGILIDWMNLTYDSQPVVKTAVIHACNAKFESMAMRELINTHISELTLPKLDASSKDPLQEG